MQIINDTLKSRLKKKKTKTENTLQDRLSLRQIFNDQSGNCISQLPVFIVIKCIRGVSLDVLGLLNGKSGGLPQCSKHQSACLRV